MRLRPTLRASHLTWAGLILLVLGIIRVSPHITACGCALVFGVACSRAITSISVARARSAGFEMLWLGDRTRVSATRHEKVMIRAELRNRDTLATYFKDLEVSHAPGLEISVHPSGGYIPAGGKLVVELHVTPRRVGYQGIFGLSLRTIRAPGLFTVPLAFSNPFVVDVAAAANPGRFFPRSRAAQNIHAAHKRVQNQRGEALELKELREHQPGDAYRRIAWKASARRGKLMVIERETETHDAVWILMDLSTDSASGEIGAAALDRAVDRAAQLIRMHQQRGDAVGLGMFGARPLRVIAPSRQLGHYLALERALCHTAHTADQDRSDWDEGDVALRVLEHARSIDRECQAISSRDYDLLLSHAVRLMRRAPVQANSAWSSHESDRVLRNYLLSFGIQPPPRGVSDRFQTELTMARFITDLHGRRRECNLISVIGRPPTADTPRQLLDAFRVARQRRIRIDFHPTPDVSQAQLSQLPARNANLKLLVASDALFHRQRLEAEDGTLQLAKLGVHVAARHPQDG